MNDACACEYVLRVSRRVSYIVMTASVYHRFSSPGRSDITTGSVHVLLFGDDNRILVSWPLSVCDLTTFLRLSNVDPNPIPPVNTKSEGDRCEDVCDWVGLPPPDRSDAVVGSANGSKGKNLSGNRREARALG